MDELDVLAPRLQQFVAVARAEHMTRAAHEAGVPQSTLSRSIARLEADLGIALFVRAGRSVALTREGRILLRHAEQALGELAAGVREVRGETSELHGRVGFAFLATLGIAVVPRLLRDFRVEHPGIRFELMQGAHRYLLDQLRSGAADLALTAPVPDEPGLAGVPLQEEEIRLVVPIGHPLAARGGIALREITHERFVGFLPGNGLRRTVEAWCREAGFVPRLAFESADVETLRGLVGAGLGVALLPVAHHPHGHGIVEIPVTQPRTTRTIGLVWVRDRELTPPARALHDFVRRADLLP